MKHMGIPTEKWPLDVFQQEGKCNIKAEVACGKQRRAKKSVKCVGKPT